MSPIGIGRVDTSGQVMYGNPKWIEMSHAGILPTLVHPDDLQKMQELWQFALDNSARVSFEVRWGTLNRFVWVLGELVPEIVVHECRGFIVVLTDITERRQVESTRLQAVEDARAREGLAIGNSPFSN